MWKYFPLIALAVCGVAAWFGIRGLPERPALRIASLVLLWMLAAVAVLLAAMWVGIVGWLAVD